ncbi:hypothetical protein ACKWTF_005781 [Chironomus riparius]
MTLGSILYHSYFIINESDMISISTLEYFVEKCNKLKMTRIYSFDKISMTWIGSVKPYEKFLEYNGCELKLMLPLTYQVDLFAYHWGYADINENMTSGFTVHGITPLIFKIAGQKYNFKDSYVPVMVCEKDWIVKYNLKTVLAARINNGINNDPNVYFDITGVQQSSYKLRTSNVFDDIKYDLIVTPGFPYSPYEKLFLPFDLTTWILLATTFGITFITIFIINRLPIKTKNFVYGRKIYTPTLNVVSIFFGIAQARLPTENFSRFILILFVIFCLIFRTCFQSKSFEFLTSEPRRPPPTTLKDLKAQNYTVYTLYKHMLEKYIQNERTNWPQIVEPKVSEYLRYYRTQSRNSSAKMCLIIEDMLRSDVDATANPKWNDLEVENIYVSHQAFFFQQKSFYFRMMLKTINSLIDTGIMKYLMGNYLRRRKFVNIPEKNKVLGLDHLSFGFNIWLGCCCISSVILFMELIIKPKSRKVPITFKFAKVHPYNANNSNQDLKV